MGSKLVVVFSVIFLLYVGLSWARQDGRIDGQKENSPRALNCSLSPALVAEIASYSWLTDLLINHLIVPGGSLKGLAYSHLSNFTDKFGFRYTGTQNLEDAIDYILNLMTSLSFENVHGESVPVHIWQRGTEKLELLQPRYKKLALLGLGSSIGTPPEGITAEIIVVDSFAELEQRAAEVPGKIVVFNQPFNSYDIARDYRENGASAASHYGAVAALIRSLASLSIYTPHTGWQTYNTTYAPVKIPVACITVEDAEMFKRMVNRGNTVQLKLYMEAQNLPDSTSRNSVGDILGTTLPGQFVVTSGHIDTWDVGQGSMDDGGGAFVGMLSAYALKTLGVSTARTLRAIAWTAEEQKLVGAYGFVQQHAAEMANYDFVTESDEGTFTANGYSFTGNDEAACIIMEILKLAAPLNVTRFEMPDAGSDTGPFDDYGVPTGAILNDNSKYFYFHHTNADTMTVENSDQLDSCVALTALVTGVVASLSVDLPRG